MLEHRLPPRRPARTAKPAALPAALASVLLAVLAACLLPGPFGAAPLRAQPGPCPEVFLPAIEVEGTFNELMCADYCHLYLTLDDGREVEYLVGGDAQDFTADVGTRITVTVERIQERALDDHEKPTGECGTVNLATTIERAGSAGPGAGPGPCPEVFLPAIEVEGTFTELMCADYCHLYLTLDDGRQVEYLVEGDAQDFTADEGTRITVTVERIQERAHDERDEPTGECGTIHLATTIERIR